MFSLAIRFYVHVFLNLDDSKQLVNIEKDFFIYYSP